MLRPVVILSGLLVPCTGLAAPRVFAASSLTDVLEECASRYQAETGMERPVLSTAATSTLAAQLKSGAPADLVITADADWMGVLERDGLVSAGSRVELATNRLVVAVPKGKWAPATIAGLVDPAVGRLAVAGQAVPAGRRAREVLAAHGVAARLQPRLVNATNARGVVALVAMDAVDAALAYRTDALASPDVAIAFDISVRDHQPIVYPMALTRKGATAPDAVAFHTWLTSPAARAIFASAGFSGATLDAGSRTPRPVPSSWSPIAMSLWVATISALLSLPFGVFLGWLLARRDFSGKALVTVITMSPLVLPPVVTGYVLLTVFGRNGWVGPLLQGLGIEIAFSSWGAVVAAAVVGFPLLVQLTRQAIEAVDPRYEQLATSLGRPPLHAFATITLPLAAPGIAAGAVLSFARALGEFGATSVLAGDIPGETRTLSLAVYALFETPGRESEAVRLVWMSIAICAVALAAYEALTRAQRRRLELS